MKLKSRYPMHQRMMVGLACAAALVLGISIAHAEPTWSPPVQLSSPLPLVNLEFDGSIALDPAGNSVAVWNGGGLILAASQAVGGLYSAAVEISQIVADEAVGAEPRVAMGPFGRAIAIWTSAIGNRRTGVVYHVRTATKLPNGTWTAPSAITMSSTTGPAYLSPRIAVDAFGNAVAVWMSCDRVTATTCVIQSSGKSIAGAWSAPVNLSAPAGNASSPQLALNPFGIAVAVWQTPAQPGTSVIQAASKRPGHGWSAAVDLSASTGFADGARVAIDALGRATAVWTQANGAVAATHAINGAWSAPVALSATGLPSGSPDVAMDLLGNATAAWIEVDADNQVNVVQVATRRPGGTWSAPAPVSTIEEDPSIPRVAMSPGGALKVVTWVDNSQNAARAVTQLERAAWTAPVTLGNGLYGTQVEVVATFGSKARAFWSLPLISPRVEAWVPAVSSFSP